MIVNGIDTKDISVVVQGAVDPVNTPICLNSIRKVFPRAEIILSTWENTSLDNLTYDVALLNKDPGGWKDSRTGIANNLNRQLVSTIAGLKRASNKYCIKVRSDIRFLSNRFLNYYNKYPKFEPEFKLFRNRILFSSYFFKRFLGEADYWVEPTPFHLSDWFVFGERTDLLMLFDIPLANEPYNTNYLRIHAKMTSKDNMFGASHQYAPEQYILLNCLRKNVDKLIKMDHIADFTIDNITFSDRFVANNFIVLNPSQIKMYCLKNGTDPYCKWSRNELALPMYVWNGLWRYDVFVDKYKQYCDTDYVIPSEAKKTKVRYLRYHKLFEKRR